MHFPFRSALLSAALLGLHASAAHARENAPAPASAAPAPLVQPPAWAHEGSDLRPDPQAVWGQLPNGFRYVILPHGDPPDRLTLRLYIGAGSLMETEEQRGLAHFLEHMAFNGSDNFKPGETVKFFERLGLGFGADTNAHTGFDETVYKLDLPKIDDKTVSQSLTLLRDQAGRLLLLPEEIEKERGVILSEKRASDSVEFRAMEAEYNFILPDSLIPKRFPIGQEDIIKSAPRDSFAAFVQKWYVPGRMVLVVVGKADPATFAPLIEKYFGDLPAAPDPAPTPSLGQVSPAAVRVKLHRDTESSSATVSIQTALPAAPEADTEARRLADTTLRLANRVIARRLEILAKLENAPFISGAAYSGKFLNFVRSSEIRLDCKPEQWKDAFALAEQQLRQALEHGFTAAELAEAKANLITDYKRAAETASTRKSRNIANSLVASFGEREVFMAPADEFELMARLISKITPADSLAALRAVWPEGQRLLFVSGNIPAADTEATISEVFAASAAKPVSPPEEAGAQKFSYQSFGAPGAVLSHTVQDDLGLVQIEFANHVRLNLKKTDFEARTIRVGLQFGGGQLEEPAAEKPGLAFAAGQVFIAGGLEAHSADDLDRIFAGRNVGAAFAVGEDSFTLAGSTTPDDLADQLRLMCAYLVAPGYREESLRQFRKQIEPMSIQIAHTADGVSSDKVERLLASGDPRFGVPAPEQLQARTLEEVKAWLAAPLRSGALEISLVGDFDPELAIKLVSETFGALPPRDANLPDFAAARQVKFPSDLSPQTFPFQTEVPKSLALVYWPTADMPSDIQRARRLNILARVLDNRLIDKLREELGDTYSPQAYHNASDTFPGYGYLAAVVISAPDKTQEIIDIIRATAADTAKGDITQDELDRALRPQLASLKEYVRSNSYWLNRVLMGSVARPAQLDWARTIQSGYENIALPELNALAQQYLPPDHALPVLVQAQPTGK